jgi:hypothetical protein
MSSRCYNADQIMGAVGNRFGLELAAENVSFFPREPHTAAPSFLWLAASIGALIKIILKGFAMQIIHSTY